MAFEVFKYNEPLERKRFLFYIFSLILIMCVIALLPIGIYPFYIVLLMFLKSILSTSIYDFVLEKLFSIEFLFLLFLYPIFITTAKRVWDITSAKKMSILYTVILFVCFIIPIVAYLAFVIFIALFFIPTQKWIKDEDNKQLLNS